MDKILVTDGGFIGSHLARYLKQQDNFVRIADIKFDDYLRGRYFEKIFDDLRKRENCLRVTQGIDKGV